MASFNVNAISTVTLSYKIKCINVLKYIKCIKKINFDGNLI